MTETGNYWRLRELKMVSYELSTVEEIDKQIPGIYGQTLDCTLQLLKED